MIKCNSVILAWRFPLSLSAIQLGGIVLCWDENMRVVLWASVQCIYCTRRNGERFWIISLLLAYFRGWWTNLITPRRSYFYTGKSLLWPLSKEVIQVGIVVYIESCYLWSVWTLKIGLGSGWRTWSYKSKGFLHIFFHFSTSRGKICFV